MRMKSGIKTLVSLTAIMAIGAAAQAQSPMRELALREAAKNAGVVPLSEIQVETDPDMVAIGAKLFESELLSFNGKTSCQTCHLDDFSSADGLPNAIGTGGEGEGPARFMSGGDIVPRNTLPFWGRGSKGFDTFFWDGKVQKVEADIISQFGEALPSKDPLVVAVHLPFVEIREMVVRDKSVVAQYEKEGISPAKEIYKILIERLKADKDLAEQLSVASGIKPEDLAFSHVAESVAQFIRSNFAVKSTKFNSFLFEKGSLTKNELQGGLIFYGKGQCSSCHSGPLMSDLGFHVMPFAQAGFGKNGFGVDYGRFNATLDQDDTYKFRTPPLINVTKTGPYSHSGAYKTLQEVIRAHTDPLGNFDAENYSVNQRREFLAKLSRWAIDNEVPEPLSNDEISELVSFLGTLETQTDQD